MNANVVWTVVIPYSATNATRWHPTESSGPFATLTRGSFHSLAEAKVWAHYHLGYSTVYAFRSVPTESDRGKRMYDLYTQCGLLTDNVGIDNVGDELL